MTLPMSAIDQLSTVGAKFKRIAILGCSGSGKSTLARHLGAILNIEIFHLDTYYWKPNWIEPDPAEFEGIVREIIQRDTWIIEGNYRITRDARLDASDTIIYLNESRWRCAFRFIRRCWFGRSRSDLPKGCKEPRLNKDLINHLLFILRFQKDKGPQLLEVLQKRRDMKRIYELCGREQVDKFIDEISTR